MKPIFVRGQYVRLLAPVYEYGKRRYPAGVVAVVVDIESFCQSTGGSWVGAQGIFIAKVKLHDGTTVRLNERAIDGCNGPV